MSEPSKPNPTNGSQSKPAGECSTSSRVGHRCPAPSPSPGLVSNLASAGTSAAPMAPPPPGIPSGASQPAQSPAPPARPGPLFRTRQPKPKHTTFKAVKIHTAKCDVCNHHNTSTLSRCIDCGWQICSSCLADRGGDRTHTGAAPGNFRSRNPAPTRANPTSNVPRPAPTTSVNPGPSNIQGPTSNAPESGGHGPDPTPINRGTPTVINPSHAPTHTTPSVLPKPTPVGRDPINPAPTNPAPTNPAAPMHRAPIMLSPTAAPVQEIPATRSVENAEKNDETKAQNNNGKGKGKEKGHSPGNNFEAEISEGSTRTEDHEVWKKWVLRPRRAVNYYPEPIDIEHTDNDKEVVVDEDSDDDTDDSDGGDIPFEAWKRVPSFPNPVNEPVQVYRPRSMAQTSTQTANQPLQTRPHFEINTDDGVNRDMDSLLVAAAEALLDLGIESLRSANRAESSNAATSSMPMHPSVSNEQQASAQSETAPSTSSGNRKRKRKAPSAQLRPAQTQGRAIRTGQPKLEVYTDPRVQASTSRAEPEANESSTSSSETEPEPMDIDEDQPFDHEEMPRETPTASGSRTTTKAAPRLQNLYRDALRVKDRNGKLKRVVRRGPKA